MSNQAEFNPGDDMGEHLDQLLSAIRAAWGALLCGQFDYADWASSVLRVMRTAVECSAIEPPGACFAAAMRAEASGTEADAERLLKQLDRWGIDLAPLRNSPEPTRPI